ncbi:hypothetical protein JR316_0001083 [Psilocybe cubensis]|uniref:Uncharacterized protein n=2 Tax=Psilocybe cubensis TaxID=181762 RepID=A0ACB8HH64_PSICU|nr:hypothetical protein JR316_0001083 [Psilocybe cubensis]KAH9487017.1 hypothetical protein JR316_0001083 [Psilocybe cubensis]
MANVLYPHTDFHPRPVPHTPSSFGFGFGLGPSPSTSMSTATGWGASTPGHTNPAAFHQLASSLTQSTSNRPQKRRHDPEDEAEHPRRSLSRDESMDRSPTPERPKRAAPKRARVLNPSESAATKDATSSKDKRNSEDSNDDDVDIGVLLASLPPQSLLPLLSSLLQTQPSLKSVILPLIPRPTLESAEQVLAQAAKRLRDAYPYSSTPTFSQGPSVFGSTRAPQSIFGPTSSSSPVGQPVMRDSYIISRLRPHVADYVSTCMSYFPYFSCIPPPTQTTDSSPGNQTTSATTIQGLHRDKFHPSETFLFLAAVTNQIINQPALTLSELAPMIVPRLTQEWKTWVDKIDEVVNREGGMFGRETVTGWERALDAMVDAKAPGVSEEVMRGIRDSWVSKVGWLVGRSSSQRMDEL